MAKPASLGQRPNCGLSLLPLQPSAKSLTLNTSMAQPAAWLDRFIYYPKSLFRPVARLDRPDIKPAALQRPPRMLVKRPHTHTTGRKRLLERPQQNKHSEVPQKHPQLERAPALLREIVALRSPRHPYVVINPRVPRRRYVVHATYQLTAKVPPQRPFRVEFAPRGRS